MSSLPTCWLRCSQPGVRGNNPRKQFLLKRIDEALLEPKVALVYHGNNVTADEWEDIRFAVTSAGGKARQLRNGVAQARLRGTRCADMPQPHRCPRPFMNGWFSRGRAVLRCCPRLAARARSWMPRCRTDDAAAAASTLADPH